MPFHVRRLFRDFFHSFFHVRLGARRLRFLVWFSVLFPLILFAGWFGFLIDNIFYRGYRRQRIERPLFIIGNYRSGSTLLQRLISLDEEQFSGMKSWEIYTAPSIAARKAWRGLATLDSWMGNPLKRAMYRWEKRVLKTIRKHPVGVMEYEEDEGLFLFIWAGIFRWFFYPHKQHEEDEHYFDTRVSEWRRRRLMKFYERCIKRHIYYRNGRKYVSKNPASSSKIRSILQKMPDARFIYLVRNPYDQLPSNFDYFSYVWHYFSDMPQRYPYRNLLLEMTQHFYSYPLQALEELPPHRYSIVTFDELIADPAGTVESIYRKLGYSISSSFSRRLSQEAHKSRSHTSSRRITIEELGISQKYMRTHYGEILRRFRFSSNMPAV
jgi:hypothetical protein